MNVKGTEYNVNFFMNIPSAKEADSVQGNSETAGAGFSQILRGKTDTIEISKHTDSSSSFLSQLKGTILGSITRDADVTSLDSLKSSISNGEYTVDADEMAELLAE